MSREDVFLTTKVWKTSLEADQVRSVTRTALEAMETEYVDLLLVHAPNDRVPIRDTMGAMNELQRSGAVRHVGVSNFSVDQLQAAMESSLTPIVTNQIEYHPRKRQDDVLEFALDNDVLVTAYSPLSKGGLSNDPVLSEIGSRYEKTPAQIALRWLVQQTNVLTIPKAASREHRYENRQIFDFSLSSEEMRTIFGLSGDERDPIVDRVVR